MAENAMTWNEKAEQFAHDTELNREAVAVAARWQREALLADEAVERVARAVYENRVAIIEDPEERRSWPAWEEHESSDADEWRAMARAALTAAIGEGGADE